MQPRSRLSRTGPTPIVILANSCTTWGAMKRPCSASTAPWPSSPNMRWHASAAPSPISSAATWCLAFREFEWRWENEHCVTRREKRSFAQPLWQGAECLEGKSIFVHSEQGLGDTIQFCRYVPLLAARGATVIVEAPPPLRQLLQDLSGVAQCIVRGDVVPSFDYYCPLLSLPLAFGTMLDTVPATAPYLRARPERVRYWETWLGESTRPRVGLVWSGGFRADQPELWGVNERRNIPLGLLAALKHPQIEFFSLQKGQPAEDELTALLARGWEGPSIVDLTRDLIDFEETAALIEQLDLVISVDTSTAHLAGALGKPVWLLNRFDTCWRWLRDRGDSPLVPGPQAVSAAAPR